ncbi:DUF1073 domain-containing protein [Brachyspira intermedia]|uniref:anti-CBASS protein Acb1 family protein n=1 Tax=Brachyspira intermedia TaxID=84377 RepID=UPI0030071733
MLPIFSGGEHNNNMSFFKDGKNPILSYDECKNIYRTATLGKRIIEGLPNFAMSAEREIDIHKAPPEAIEKFKETADEMKQDEAIKRTIYNSRIYGTGALYVAMYDEEKEEDDFTTKPTFENAHKYKMKFTVMDPLNISGSRVDLNPLSFHFLEVIDVQVGSKQIPKKRIVVSHALEPLYLDSRTSLIPFSPPSVFYNMAALLNQYDDAIKSIGDLLYKAGAIIYKYPAKAKLNGVTIDAITASKQILEQKRSGEVISISADSTIEDFPISNLSGLIESINKLEDDITKALNDTPASILFDKSLSNGFSEGDKDKETEISIIESFRENKLTPLYNLTDYYVMLKAWDSAFIDDMRYKYSEYQDQTDSEIFRSWAENFKFQYGSLFPEPESVTQDNNAKKLDNLLKAQQLGANPADLQEELNESEIFKNEMELDSQPQGMGGMEGAEDDEAMFDYSKNNSEDEANFNKPPSVSGIKADTDAYSGQSPNFKEEEHKRDKDGKFTKGSGEDNKQEDKEETNNEDSSEEKQKEEKEIKEKIKQLEKIDWTKDNTLPNLNKNTLKELNLEDKPVLLKKNIIEKNKLNHPDITEEKAKRIIGNALYKPELILKANIDKPAYHNFISRTDNEHSDIVLLELSEEKENYEIINYHIIDNNARNRKIKKHNKS